MKKLNRNIPLQQGVLGRTGKKPFSLQRNHAHYTTPSYLSPRRMSSYGHQYALAMSTKCSTFLNIGSANWILSTLLTQQKKFVIDLDIDLATNPHILGSLPYLPFLDNSIEAVLCFQVLEHLPFIIFIDCIKELSRIAKKSIIISLPDRTLLKADKVKRLIYLLVHNPRKWYRYNKVNIDPEHFWEIGINGVSDSVILNIIAGLEINVVSHYRNELFDYHHFFLLEKQDL